jgi:heavy-metal-associated domain-containing protein
VFPIYLVAELLGQALLQALIGEATGQTIRRLRRASEPAQPLSQPTIGAAPAAPRLLDAVEIASTIRGRVRLTVTGLRGNGILAGRLEEALRALPGGDEAEASARTGRLLLRFDPAQHQAETLRLAVERARARLFDPAPGRGAQLGAVV